MQVPEPTSPSRNDPSTGLPIGPEVDDPSPAAPPGDRVRAGRWARLEPLDPSVHADDLFEASTPPDADARFTYLPVPAPRNRSAFDRWLDQVCQAVDDRRYDAVIDQSTGRAVGRQAYLRIDPANRSVELGDVYWGPAMSRSRVATEAFFLAASHVFDDLGYRRFEWKCDSLNGPSRRAAQRFGFSYEGTFRRAVIYKGRSRDTAWYSMLDEEWPTIRAGFERWLDPTNFDDDGRQRNALRARPESG